MKNIPALFLILLSTQFIWSQQFRTVTVKGNFTLLPRNAAVRSDQTLNATAKLKCSENGSGLLVTDKKKLYVLNCRSSDTLTLKQHAFELKDRIRKTEGAVNSLADLKDRFGEKSLLLGINAVFIGNFPFTLSDSNYFFLRTPADVTQMKRILFTSGDTLYFKAEDIYGRENTLKTNDVATELYYRTMGIDHLITSFHFIRPDEKQLQKERTAVYAAIQAGPNEKLKNFGNYLMEFYGHCDLNDLINYFKTQKE